MKQPKFRGFNIETSEWHYGHGWFEVDYTEEYKREKGISDKALLHTNASPVECELRSMGQFIGLEDNDDLELYEGDIVRIQEVREEIKFPVYTGEIVFANASFCVDTGTSKHYRWMDYEVEKLGNKFEHPKLLELF